jgi:hypothetical protein
MAENFEIPTPFGLVHVPFPKLPKLDSPKMDERRSRALAHAIGEDLTTIVALVPLVGDIIADVVGDTHYAEEVKNLTPSEHARFLEHNKIAPSTIAMLRTFMEV